MATNAERIEAATVMAEEASQVMDDFTRFDDTQDVTNQDAEVFPSLQKFLKNAQDDIDSITGQILASQAEAEAGVENSKVMTSLRVKQSLDFNRPYASQAEAEAGTENTKVLTSLRTAQAIAAQASSGGGSAGKNKIIGGDFATNPWQRGTSFAAMANETFMADRWIYGNNTTAVHTGSKVTGESTGRNALRIEATTADAAVAAGDLTQIVHKIEGYNIVPLLAGATFSCRVKSDVTGLLPFAFRNASPDRTYVAEIDILAADTWQDVEIVIPAFPSAGTWDYTNGEGLHVSFSLAVGSTYHTTADAWQTGNFMGTSSSVNRNASIGNYVEIDQVQMEAGTEKTTFENLLVNEVLRLCHRYFIKQSFQKYGWNKTGATTATGTEQLPERMRGAVSATANSSNTTNTSSSTVLVSGVSSGHRISLDAGNVVSDATSFQFGADIDLDAEL
ncbi:MAG: hypothetical protein CMI54_05685 [Parcubacteria group bacterium]|nr:hypothetical protein [Parcubacteria group bacterium]|tara:strand:- start:16690 stop:18033 length:1344 start_codon:yes stop_codon:yes gene_type:complete